MTPVGTHIAAVLATGAIAAGSVTGAVFGADASTGDEAAQPTALVIDASLASHGREPVDGRLENVDAAVRLPANADEARVNVRYFDALDYRVYVAGATAAKAAEHAGVDATVVDGLDAALAAAR